ncbi:protein COFACTOR ASSEMBLY OF COMPLEX C SUBUNIT B CCB3, chloroplastic isoform X2 [Ricinus communis]|uniref:protein COFACTOR ASSEMBLY OF COMPLEX C SUBUNIT B CCB3, chloroplastic isoform X2 n=1 Tax=Ricinus communis TaxID=3988 RepID=UPI000772AEA2|nr:protein COFACTOR ASSEMBLY OF COMPLEX C SUBUNIT B CCB3, chloroplastic isoform X2 [Ricinus communis]|eukprot:XP_015582584.1 protein COFACTOR ASSEMBLY OF COMPLEX C SUBUNIT B CCB3, chloroplastic isoform X2 [Ricinus communis]
MATCASLFSNTQIKGWRPLVHKKQKFNFSFNCLIRRNPSDDYHVLQSSIRCSAVNTELLPTYATISERPLNSFEDVQNINLNVVKTSEATSKFIQSSVVADLDPATAKLAIGFLGPFLSAFGFLFILRIVMSWYPKLPVGKFPYVIAYAPTEPILVPTRKVIPPVGGVDVTPVVWFGLISFLNEILLGPQGLLVLLSQQVN